MITNLSETELTKVLAKAGIHQKRMPGIIKLIKKPSVKAGLFAVAVTGATAYVYQQLEEGGRQSTVNSNQTSVQQPPSGVEAKPQPETAALPPAQDNQPRGYNIYTVGAIFGVLAFIAYRILHKTEWVQ